MPDRVRTPIAGLFELVRTEVEAHLSGFFDRKLDCARALASELEDVVESVRELTMRGGKRLRPAVLVAGYRSAGARELEAIWQPAAALELLQTYLLIQDDWMDGDLERRGGPSVHAALERHFPDRHTAASIAILASDLASAYAEECLATSRFSADRVVEALTSYATMHQEVVLGQSLDVMASGDVETVHRLKTASYTVVVPLAIGAILAGASSEQQTMLRNFGTPLGIAFQMRDDILGTLGDPARMGKAAKSDLLRNKRTALFAEALRRASTSDAARLQSISTEADVEVARTIIVDCGAKDAIEARIASLYADAMRALEGDLLSEVDLLRALARLLVDRAS